MCAAFRFHAAWGLDRRNRAARGIRVRALTGALSLCAGARQVGKVEHTHEVTDVSKDAHPDPALVAKNPNHHVPMFKDADDFIVWESNAIMRCVPPSAQQRSPSALAATERGGCPCFGWGGSASPHDTWSVASIASVGCRFHAFVPA